MDAEFLRLAQEAVTALQLQARGARAGSRLPSLSSTVRQSWCSISGCGR